ncbi:Teichoic acid translocation permease protein TagG [Lacunisphaera limnophila]|uniref:Transport permease protein n=1 Tax=Lacunisphaera limnophila TaxID=1838286 RepID=A0A1D8AVW3_9BACT|nr:ABC transporter permease [Lacunisphaera limnophila]AOS45006.1 Teichoic acid translocation permease protein TagG [Lacunisphaera limnophila]
MLSRLPASVTSLWQHRELLRQFTLRNVELRHKGSHLGLIWSFLNPLLLLGLYVLVFGYIFGGRFKPADVAESRVEYALVIFLGLAIHHFIAEVLAVAPSLILNSPNFVKKVVFPLEILPAACVGSAALHFLITLGLVLIGALLTGVPLHAGVLWLPVLLLPVLLAAYGLALGLGALGVFWRDVAQIVQFASLVLLFASAVFYPLAKIPPDAWVFLKFNPLLLTIEAARGLVFWDRPLNLRHLGYLYAFGTVACLLGATLFQRLRGGFADVL